MIGLNRFIGDVKRVIKRDISMNEGQNVAICACASDSLRVVAGPGSGKTTVVVLRLLKLVFVDDVPVKSIFATTFTRKAAKELKSRILTWGMALQEFYLNSDFLDAEVKNLISRLDFNQVVTGTLDSLAEEILTQNRLPDENPPAVINEFVSGQIMVGSYFGHDDRKDKIREELKEYSVSTNRFNVSSASKNLLDIYNRAMENMVDLENLEACVPNLSMPIEDYSQTLKRKHLMDFPSLESEFLKYVSSSRSDVFVNDIKVLMVDEYQDTNILQESIYKKMGEKIVSNGGNIIIVGDDDQSIYRFRGSRVHLFADLDRRFADSGVEFKTIFLSSNYRSTPEIVDYCNRFIRIDDEYQKARVLEKPLMVAERSCDEHVPVLGIFKENEEEIAEAIVKMVNEYVVNGKFTFESVDGSEYTLERGESGSADDFVLLMNSTSYFRKSSSKDNALKPCLPQYIHECFEKSGSGICEFNPRGTNIYDDEHMMILCGIILTCLDPDAAIQNDAKLEDSVKSTFNMWRKVAKDFIDSSPVYEGASLKEYVDCWIHGVPYPRGGKWDKKEVGIIDLINNVCTWIPPLRNDAEKLVYLQALTDAVSKSVLIKNREMNLRFEAGSSIKKQSVKDLYFTILAPFARGTLEVDEELFFSVQMKDRFNIMTIHQSKGLEFPITIVDVGSNFKGNYATQRNMRFPETLDQTSGIERLMRNIRKDIPDDRPLLDLQFDDIIRKSFVAFSRAQDVLILVGSTKVLKLKHMALGSRRTDKEVNNRIGNVKMMR